MARLSRATEEWFVSELSSRICRISWSQATWVLYASSLKALTVMVQSNGQVLVIDHQLRRTR